MEIRFNAKWEINDVIVVINIIYIIYIYIHRRVVSLNIVCHISTTTTPSLKSMNNKNFDKIVVADGYQYIVMAWWRIKHKCIYDQNISQVYGCINVSLRVTSTENFRLSECASNKHRKIKRDIMWCESFCPDVADKQWMYLVDVGSALQLW